MLKQISIGGKCFARGFSSKNVAIPKGQMLINGKWVNSVEGKTFETVNPATEEVLQKVQDGTAKDVDIAVEAAVKAFNGPWRRATVWERYDKINKFISLLEKHSDEIAALDTLDNGKPFEHAKIDVFTGIEMLKGYNTQTPNIYGETIPLDNGHFCYTRQEPVGVCGQIIPWNFPFVMACMKLGPMLATGCSSVLKPAEQTPLSALRMGELILEAGIPEGVVNIVTGDGKVGEALVKHPKIDKIAFTGSTEVGLQIMKNSGLKRVSLELGGKAANVVMDDANLESAVHNALFATYINNGQLCMSGSRTFVQEGIYNDFVKAAMEAKKTYKVGDPFDPDTFHGPIVSKEQLDKVHNYIQIGKKEGASLKIGGNLMQGKGYYIEPAVFTDLKDDMTIAREEIFGPVLSIFKFKDLDEVIKRANDSTYGLSAGINTNSMETALAFAKKVRCGSIFVNNYFTTSAHTPHGGFKNSGIGRELGLEGVKMYTESKTVVIKERSSN